MDCKTGTFPTFPAQTDPGAARENDATFVQEELYGVGPDSNSPPRDVAFLDTWTLASVGVMVRCSLIFLLLFPCLFFINVTLWFTWSVHAACPARLSYLIKHRASENPVGNRTDFKLPPSTVRIVQFG